MDNRKAILIFGLLGLGLLFMLTRGSRTESYSEESVALPFRPASRVGGRRYINTKEWNITYNEDGLPVKIVKHVEAEVT